MAKVTLLTSREIFNRFKLEDNTDQVKKLDFEDAYKKVFEKKSDSTGIVSKILTRRQGAALYNQLSDEEKKDPNKVAKLVIPDHKGGKRRDFTAGVFRYPKKNPKGECLEYIYYFAKEYPYFEDASKAKYEYMNALLEMIFKDLGKTYIEEFKIFSHDRDWDVQADDIYIKKHPKMEAYSYLKKIFDEYNGKVKVFQHHSSSCLERILNENFSITIKKTIKT